MSGRGSRRMSYREAARAIYAAREPTDLQLAGIDEKVTRGALHGNRSRRWVATDSVIAYIAMRAERQRLSARAEPAGIAGDRSPLDAPPSAIDLARELLPPIYREGLRDYFAAVIRRRRPAGASAAFGRAVLVGQIVLILFPIVAVVALYAVAVRPPREHAAVQALLEREVASGAIDEYTIVEWAPSETDPREEGTRIRVRYRYSENGGKSILTDRTYLVRGETAVRARDPSDD
ncbi:MAG: hypothetical protein WD069_17385 [Planctomycetales bacterium]